MKNYSTNAKVSDDLVLWYVYIYFSQNIYTGIIALIQANFLW